jgi:hypothetical protein
MENEITTDLPKNFNINTKMKKKTSVNDNSKLVHFQKSKSSKKLIAELTYLQLPS